MDGITKKDLLFGAKSIENGQVIQSLLKGIKHHVYLGSVAAEGNEM